MSNFSIGDAFLEEPFNNENEVEDPLAITARDVVTLFTDKEPILLGIEKTSVRVRSPVTVSSDVLITSNCLEIFPNDDDDDLDSADEEDIPTATEEAQIIRPDEEDVQIIRSDEEDVQIIRPDEEDVQIIRPDDEDVQIIRPDDEDVQIIRPDEEDVQIIRPDDEDDPDDPEGSLDVKNIEPLLVPRIAEEKSSLLTDSDSGDLGVRIMKVYGNVNLPRAISPVSEVQVGDETAGLIDNGTEVTKDVNVKNVLKASPKVNIIPKGLKRIFRDEGCIIEKPRVKTRGIKRDYTLLLEENDPFKMGTRNSLPKVNSGESMSLKEKSKPQNGDEEELIDVETVDSSPEFGFDSQDTDFLPSGSKKTYRNNRLVTSTTLERRTLAAISRQSLSDDDSQDPDFLPSGSKKKYHNNRLAPSATVESTPGEQEKSNETSKPNFPRLSVISSSKPKLLNSKGKGRQGLKRSPRKVDLPSVRSWKRSQKWTNTQHVDLVEVPDTVWLQDWDELLRCTWTEVRIPNTCSQSQVALNSYLGVKDVKYHIGYLDPESDVTSRNQMERMRRAELRKYSDQLATLIGLEQGISIRNILEKCVREINIYSNELVSMEKNILQLKETQNKLKKKLIGSQKCYKKRKKEA